MTWSVSTGATSYNIKRSTTSGGPYTQLAAATSPSYTDANVTNGTTYFYVVTASNAGGESSDSAQVAVTPDPAVTTPAIPMGLKAMAGNAKVSLNWSASSGASGYHVKRATKSGGAYTDIGAPSSTAYTDSSVSNGSMYFYVITALDSAGESGNSAQVSALPVAPTVIPAVPTGVSATPGNAQVTLSWATTSGATGYHVKRATTNGGPYTQIGAPTADAYSDTTTLNGTTYYYVVSALDSAGESSNSAQVSALPVAPASIPVIPSGLAATAGNSQVTLSWTASTSAMGYHVKRATVSGGPYTQVAAPNSTGYADTAVTDGTTYFYVVSAFDSAGESANSAQVSSLPVAPTAPSPPPTSFGTWINVTPSAVNIAGSFSCGNYGTESVQADPAHPSNLYTEFNCQGIWKSTDYGVTWTGPINTGSNGALVGDCAGGITIPSSGSGSVPTIYESCIRGSGTGFWKSVDGGVNWTRYFVAPSGSSRQDYYPPVADPYDANHLLMAGHEMDYLVESVDGGQTWTNLPLASGMLENGGTGAIFFINTGNAASTRTTWMWMAQQSGGIYGTWRTANSGAHWSQVDKNEHPHGASQIYQPDNNGVVYMTGAYSSLGWGVLKSGDYGQTWSHVGMSNNENAVFGTPKNVYAMFGYPIGAGGVNNPAFEIASQPGTGTWAAPGTPAALTQGSAQIAVVNDGTHNVFIGAMWNSGVWRYVEP